MVTNYRVTNKKTNKIMFECLNCGRIAIYKSNTSDGKRCPQCDGGPFVALGYAVRRSDDQIRISKAKRKEIKHFIDHNIMGLKSEQAIKRLDKLGVMHPEKFYHHWRALYVSSISNLTESPHDDIIHTQRRVRMSKKVEDRVITLYKQGLTQTQISERVGFSTSAIRDKIKIYKSKRLEG